LGVDHFSHTYTVEPGPLPPAGVLTLVIIFVVVVIAIKVVVGVVFTHPLDRIYFSGTSMLSAGSGTLICT
jgi:hypothetical protein